MLRFVAVSFCHGLLTGYWRPCPALPGHSFPEIVFKRPKIRDHLESVNRNGLRVPGFGLGLECGPMRGAVDAGQNAK